MQRRLSPLLLALLLSCGDVQSQADIVIDTRGEGGGEDGEVVPTRRRRLLVTVPFTGNGHNNNMGYNHAAAMQLALDHYHARNATVVSEFMTQLAPADEDCPIEWTLIVRDSESSGSASVRALMDEEEEEEEDVVDAVIGGYQYGEVPALELTAAANAMQIPSVMYGGSNLRVVTQRQYPYSTRTHPDALAFGPPLMEYLHDFVNRTNYFGILAPSLSEVALQAQQVLEEAAHSRCITTHVAHYEPNHEYIPGSKTAEQALRKLKQTGFRTLLLMLDDWERELPIVAQAAVSQHMMFEDYVWVLVGNLELMQLSNKEMVSNHVYHLLRGALYVQPLELFGLMGKQDPFLQAWQHPAPGFAKRVNELVPKNISFRAESNGYFESGDPGCGAGFAYDAAMAVMLGACQVPTESPQELYAYHHTRAIHRSNFMGASGYVRFEYNFSEFPGSRAHYTLPFGVYNLLIPGKDETQLAAVREGGMSPADAKIWQVRMPFVFANGLTTGPPLRDEPNGNYLNATARIVGLTFYGLVLVLIVLCSAWTVVYRKERIVRAAQPAFLHALLFGSALVATVIPLNSFDESYGWTADELSLACTATPWLLVCGLQVIYSSLWIKLWRVHKVLQFRRRAVTIAAVVWPAVALFAVVLILLAVWTGVQGGFHWSRSVQDEMTGESAAKCVGTNSLAFFVPIVILMLIPVVLTLVMSWKTKDVASEYSENVWLFALVVFQVQLLVITIPLFLLVEDSMSTVRYIVQVAVFVLFSASTVTLVMLPKIVRYYCPAEESGGAGDARTMLLKRGSSMGLTRVSGLHLTTTASTNDLNSTTSSFHQRRSTTRGEDLTHSSSFHQRRSTRRGHEDLNSSSFHSAASRVNNNREEASDWHSPPPEDASPRARHSRCKREITVSQDTTASFAEDIDDDIIPEEEDEDLSFHPGCEPVFHADPHEESKSSKTEAPSSHTGDDDGGHDGCGGADKEAAAEHTSLFLPSESVVDV